MTVNNISIDVIGLSVRSSNALHRLGVHTVGAMMDYTEETLSAVRNLGKKSVAEILAKIEEYKRLETADHPCVPDAEDEEAVRRWLENTQVGIDALELLCAKAFNLLMLNGYEYLYQLAFLSSEDLQTIPRMDEATAQEIVQLTADYIMAHKDEMSMPKETVTVCEMRFMPQFQEAMRAFVMQNDIPIEKMPLSNRPKNQLQKNGYHKLSDILFLTAVDLRSLPAMGMLSVQEIVDAIEKYLITHEARIVAFCDGDISATWDDATLRDRVLQLYPETPFGGFSLTEMIEKMKLPEGVSEEQVKRVVGRLLAEKKLEYVDFRCYRLYESFSAFLSRCDILDERSNDILWRRLQGETLEEIAQTYGLTRERVRQVVKKRVAQVRSYYEGLTGDVWFDEDYYWYFFENYAFDRRDISSWLGVSQAVWNYLEMMDVKPGVKELEAALDDHENLEIGLRLKVKNYLNRNKIFVDGVWVEKQRSELERIVARKRCQDEMSFEMFAETFNNFLKEEEIPYDENLYYTDAVMRTRKNHLSDAKYLLWKQNEMLRYYDIESRDYTELYETLQLDVYENVEYSTLKFVREYPVLMSKYDIRDQYELHNLLRKTVPEGDWHDFRCGRMPMIKFGTFDRDAAMWELLTEMSPVKTQDLLDRISQEYGYESGAVFGTYLSSFNTYLHDGVYSIDQKVMPSDRREALHAALPNDFYYIDEIRKIYASLFADADVEEVNPYNLKQMGFVVLSRYAVQHYPTLEAYCEHLLTDEDVVDLAPIRRKKLTYMQTFSGKMMELKRRWDVIEFEPGKLLNFRKLAVAGITKEELRAYCDAVYDFVEDGTYFTVQSLRRDGFESELYDLGFSDWFYANVLLADERLSYMQAMSTMIFYKGKTDISLQSFLLGRVEAHGCVDVYDLMTELEEGFGCRISEKGDVIYPLNNTKVYRDKILDRLYANVDLYYHDLEKGGF